MERIANGDFTNRKGAYKMEKTIFRLESYFYSIFFTIFAEYI
jgi:hypothetical protein